MAIGRRGRRKLAAAIGTRQGKDKEDDDPRSSIFKGRHLAEAQPMGHGARCGGPPRPWRGREKRGDALTSQVSILGPRTLSTSNNRWDEPLKHH
jgi:hypothetical protein